MDERPGDGADKPCQAADARRMLHPTSVNRRVPQSLNPDPSWTSHLDLQDVSLMGRPPPHDESCPGVQQHNETRGEASHNAAPIRTDSQAADEPSAHPTGQAELVLQERVQLLGDKDQGIWHLGDKGPWGPAGFCGVIAASFGPAMVQSLSTQMEEGGSQNARLPTCSPGFL